MSKKKKVTAFDGWNNLFTGVGVDGRDRRLATSYTSKSLMTEGELSQLYSDNGFVRRIVDKHVEAMMMKGFRVAGDEKDQVLARFDELNLWTSIERLLKWNRLHGGAVMVLGIDDNSVEMDKPLNEKGIRKILFARTYDRWQVTVNRVGDTYDDPKNPKYGKIQYYNVQPTNGLASFRVHESRVVVLDGVDVPDRVRQLNQGWGLSFIQHCFEQLRQVGAVFDAVESITEDFITQTITMENLMQLLAAGKESVVKRRLELIDLSRSVFHTTLLDKEETFEKKASTVAELPDVMDKFLQALSIVTGMPARILLGRQGGGLNNEGEGETRDWYDSVASEQVRIYKSNVLERLVRLVMLERDGRFKGRELKDWFIKFTPLYQLSEKEVAEIRKMHAEADTAYVQNGVLEPEEVAIARFGGADYGNDVKLLTTDRNLNKGGGDESDGND
jgi:phage-related protein (TIGR01555 family)